MVMMMIMTMMVILMHMKYIGTGGIDHHVFTVLCFDLPNQVSSGQVALHPKTNNFLLDLIIIIGIPTLQCC